MKLPAGWNEITVEKYQRLMAAKKHEDAIEQEISTLSILSDTAEWQIENIPIDKLKGYVKQTSFLSVLPVNKDLPKQIRIAGKKYLINLKINDIFGGQYIDLQTLTKDPDKITERLHEILAIFIHPMQRKYFMWFPVPYSGEKHREAANEIQQHLTMDIAYPIALFFCSLYENSINGIQDYFVKKAEAQILEAKIVLAKQLRKKAKDSLRNGDGS